MVAIEMVLLMLLAIVASGYLARAFHFGMPLPLVQIALGAVLQGWLNKGLVLEPPTFFLLFVAPLLFFDGWRVPNQAIFRDRGIILQLALGLVVFTVVCGGLLIHWLVPGMPMALAFALAAILSPTDPVSISDMASRVPIPKRVVHVLEGEALLNDATGLVCFRFAVAAAVTGQFSLTQASLTFIWLALGGVGVGMGLTVVVSQMRQWLAQRVGEESGLPILVSLLIPFGAYLSAEFVHASGVLAAVAAGITMSQLELRPNAPATTRLHRKAVWDMIQFVLNGMVFVLMGEQLPRTLRGAATSMQHGGLTDVWLLIGAALAIQAGLLALRFIWVWVSLRIAMFQWRKQADGGDDWFHTKLVLVMSLAGARGAVTLAGVMSLPLVLPNGAPFPQRDLALFLVTAVILSSLVIACTVLPRLLPKMDLPTDAPEHEQEQAQESLARKEAARAAIVAISRACKRLRQEGFDAQALLQAQDKVASSYRLSFDVLGRREGPAQKPCSHVDQVAQAERLLRIEAWSGERERILGLVRETCISEEVSRKLVREIDLQESRER